MNVNIVGISPYMLNKANPHSHNYWEIVLNLEGDGLSVIDGKEYPFYPGSIICQPPDVLHSKTSENKFRDIFIQVNNFLLPTQDAVPVFTDDEEKSFETLMFMALRIFHKKSPNFITIVNSLFETMYGLLSGWSENKPKNEHVELFKNELIENFTNPEFRIADAMNKTAYCTDHFRKCFKKETGITPVSYLSNLRVEYAKKLLRQKGESKMVIGDIAFLSGFFDARYFSRAFKNAVGITPQEYALNYKKKNDQLTIL